MLLGIYFSEAILPVGSKRSSAACDRKECDLPLLVVQLSIIATALLGLHDGRHSPEHKAEVEMRKRRDHGAPQFQFGNADVDVFLPKLHSMEKPRNLFSPPSNPSYAYLL